VPVLFLEYVVSSYWRASRPLAGTQKETCARYIQHGEKILGKREFSERTAAGRHGAARGSRQIGLDLNGSGAVRRHRGHRNMCWEPSTPTSAPRGSGAMRGHRGRCGHCGSRHPKVRGPDLPACVVRVAKQCVGTTASAACAGSRHPRQSCVLPAAVREPQAGRGPQTIIDVIV